MCCLIGSAGTSVVSEDREKLHSRSTGNKANTRAQTNIWRVFEYSDIQIQNLIFEYSFQGHQ